MTVAGNPRPKPMHSDVVYYFEGVGGVFLTYVQKHRVPEENRKKTGR